MDRREAIEILRKRRTCALYDSDVEALDLAIEALKGDLHCPKCGTIVRDGRQYHDLVYRGEAEKHQLSGETSTNFGVSEDGKTSWRAEPQEHGLFSDIDDWAKRKVKEMTEPKVSEDCISRQQAIEEMSEVPFILFYDYNMEQDELVDTIEEQIRGCVQRMLKSLPPITPTERTGEWVGGRL